MRPAAVITGVLITIIGSAAAISGEFNQAWTWILVIAIGVGGITGLVTAITSHNHPS